MIELEPLDFGVLWPASCHSALEASNVDVQWHIRGGKARSVSSRCLTDHLDISPYQLWIQSHW